MSSDETENIFVACVLAVLAVVCSRQCAVCKTKM